MVIVVAVVGVGVRRLLWQCPAVTEQSECARHSFDARAAQAGLRVGVGAGIKSSLLLGPALLMHCFALNLHTGLLLQSRAPKVLQLPAATTALEM